MNIQIKEVNEFNRQEILKLRVKDTQVGYIESVEECLQESEEVSLWRPVGLYRDELLIGFAKYADEVCLLFGLTGQTLNSMKKDIETGLSLFERVCINIMVENSTKTKTGR